MGQLFLHRENAEARQRSVQMFTRTKWAAEELPGFFSDNTKVRWQKYPVVSTMELL